MSECVSECWRFYAVPTARVIFTAKTSLDFFSHIGEQVWTFCPRSNMISWLSIPDTIMG